MPAKLHLTLDPVDACELLAGIRITADSWQRTAEYLMTDYLSEDEFCIEACSDHNEAQTTARRLNALAQDIERQIQNQTRQIE